MGEKGEDIESANKQDNKITPAGAQVLPPDQAKDLLRHHLESGFESLKNKEPIQINGPAFTIGGPYPFTKVYVISKSADGYYEVALVDKLRPGTEQPTNSFRVHKDDLFSMDDYDRVLIGD